MCTLYHMVVITATIYLLTLPTNWHFKVSINYILLALYSLTMVTLTKYSHLLLSTVVGNDVSDVLIGWVHLKKPLTSLAFTTDDTSHWIQ